MKDILKIILGNLLISSAYAYLTVPEKIINGGVTSSALIINSIINFDLALITNILTIFLLIICLIFLGKEYFTKSILSSVCYMIFFNLFYYSSIKVSFNIVITLILSSILVSLGYYLCISAKSSTVGFDVIALILNNKNPKINIAVALRYINFLVLICGFLVFGYSSIIKGLAFTILYSSMLKILLKKTTSNLKFK